jgi:hypothetical protein
MATPAATSELEKKRCRDPVVSVDPLAATERAAGMASLRSRGRAAFAVRA